MTEIRCVKCRRLLMKAEVVKAEIKCPKCGYLNNFITLGDFKIYADPNLPPCALDSKGNVHPIISMDEAPKRVSAEYTGEIFNDQHLENILDRF